MDALSVQLLLLAVAAFAGVAAALAAWHGVRVGLEEFLSGQKEEIYLEYTRRYQEIVKGLPATFFDRDESSGKSNVSDEDRRLAHTYIDLCSEEVKLRLRGMISNLVWQDWEDG